MLSRTSEQAAETVRWASGRVERGHGKEARGVGNRKASLRKSQICKGGKMVAGPISEADMEKAKAAIAYIDEGGPPSSGKFEELSMRGDPTKDRDALKVWRRPGPGGVFEYLIVGAAPYKKETFFNVLKDLEYHKKWDDYCGDLKCIAKSDDGTTDFIYWEVKYPLLFSNRDYVYARRERLDEDGTYVFVTKATTHKSMPDVKGRIRVSGYEGTYILRERAGDPSVTEYVYFMFDDPRGNIPKKIVNWVVSTAIPGFMKTLYGACENIQN